MSTFKLGDKVYWESQAAGSKIKKAGTIIHCLGGGANPMNVHQKLREKHNAKSNYGGGRARKHESYFVLVEEFTKNGTPKKPSLYWPNASALKVDGVI